MACPRRRGADRSRSNHAGVFLGVAATGRAVTTQEFAIYRFENDVIAEVWVAADNLRLVDQLR